MDADVAVSLTHMLRRFYAPGYAYNRFYAHRLHFTRPAVGRARYEVRCPTCDKVLTCVVTDARGTVRMRVVFGVAAGLLLLAMVLAFVFGVPAVVGRPSPVPAVLLVVGVLAAFVPLVRSAVRAFGYTGVYVRSAVPPFLPRRHEIFGAGWSDGPG